MTGAAAIDPPVPPTRVRWAPDDQLVAAILAGSPTTMADLAPADRAWVVAGLNRAGHTAEQIKDRLHCALRTVRTILADPLTTVCRLLQDESEHFASELRLVQAELRASIIQERETAAARDRYRVQLFNVLDTAITEGVVTTFPCGCPRTRYNTYIAPKTGKAGCREHRRLAVQRHRERTRIESGVRTIDSVPSAP